MNGESDKEDYLIASSCLGCFMKRIAAGIADFLHIDISYGMCYAQN